MAAPTAAIPPWGRDGLKYILVTGGVISGIGKGVTSASMGALLHSKGLHCTTIKCDPYLNEVRRFARCRPSPSLLGACNLPWRRVHCRTPR